ncbi:MFS transporter [Granulicella mallensis]|uniref:Major facilitator superfamily MFS_1 n=1 Tax=Granulicella mallensis (strain ATCC BAA-1857 / DSM 23137 / MP5ACTX8) TaxID=682795 RepID=G8NQB8_GRAMM|nr:MFS transporter [Granulicella mallensis]AEU36067.1 major facilitator superfamily MFS_1 [Granulicella mallensis MP5ACTX8]
MELLLSQAGAGKGTPFWRSPAAWLREKKLSRGFWIFFAAAFFFDFGFSIYIFLFNLYLLDFHFNERAMGLIGGAATLGHVMGTLPAGVLARKIGIRPLMIVCFIASTVLCALRVVIVQEHAQLVLAFLSGVAMCLWGVCFLPAVARLTTEDNRASAFSFFSVNTGVVMLGGIVCGYLQQWLKMAGLVLQPVEVKRIILLASCAIAAIGLVAVLRLEMPAILQEESQGQKPKRWMPHPFLLRYLPALALWTAVLVAFTPFANVYLSKNLHVPMSRIGLIFSVAQVLQLVVGLLTPVLYRRLGMVPGIVVTQMATAVTLACLAATHDSQAAMGLYLGFSALQCMSAPGLYNLLMSKLPDEERSTASSGALFCNAVVSSGTMAGAGILFVRFGYPHVLMGIAGLAFAVAMLFWLLIGPMDRRVPTQPQIEAGSFEGIGVEG